MGKYDSDWVVGWLSPRENDASPILVGDGYGGAFELEIVEFLVILICQGDIREFEVAGSR